MKPLAALSLTALALAACGGSGGDAEDVLAQTTGNLEEITSGNLLVRLVVTPKGEGSTKVGFELRGPFSLKGPGDLPVARIAFTQISRTERGTVTVLSTGRKAYVEMKGKAYELPPGQATQLRLAGVELMKGDGLGGLGAEDWIHSPRLSDGGVVGGAETDRLEANLDVAAAAQDLVELAGILAQGSLGSLPDTDEQTIERATRSAEVQLFTGREDRLLRRLDIHVDLGFDVPGDLQRALGSLVGARVDFELRINNPNQSVAVSAPQDVLPYSDMPNR